MPLSVHGPIEPEAPTRAPSPLILCYTPKMSKALATAAAVSFFVFAPAMAFAAVTVSFSPASPQVYNGTSEVSLTVSGLEDGDGCGTGGGCLLVAFAPDNTTNATNVPNAMLSYASSDGTYNYADQFSGGNTFQQDMGGAGVAHFLVVDPETTTDACTGAGFGTVAACKDTAAYLGQDFSYVITPSGFSFISSETAGSAGATLGQYTKNNISGIFSLVVLALSFPVAFYILGSLLGLFPRKRKR